MKRLLFILSRFLDGGIDMVLVDYLRRLAACPDYRIGLAISTKMDELEVFADAIPKNVTVHHLVSNKSLTRWRKQKVKGTVPAYAKVWDEAILSPVRRHLIGKGLRRLASEYDVMIDFDCCHYAWLKTIAVRKLVWFHFSFKHLMEQNPRRTRRIGRHLGCYDRIVVISKAMQEEGEELFPWLDGKWSLIYNAKDKALLEQKAAEAVDDKRISQPYILAVERLEESQKDTTTLLHAYRLYKDAWPQAEKLYILGKGRDKHLLQQTAVRLGIQDDVEFLGFTPNPYPWIMNARLIAHSAKMEGLPTAMIESLVLGKLIVATDCPTGPREILDDGKAGLLVPVGDARAMADAFHRVLTDRPLQQQLLTHAATHQRNFLFESTLQRLEQLL
jgi:glycosyltransferase involved in cell wall biosynthesis